MSRAHRIFEEAIERAGPEREAFVAGACRGDGALRAEVESLLRAHADAGRFLLEPTHGGPHSQTLPGAGAEVAGALVGRYKLLQLIGEGGFGSVFMAEQTEPVVRRVALKIIKLGMDTRAVIARFEAERQALAMMDHPNIAKVLDAGATERGRPYFVMELVRGDPITVYCDRNSLNIEERLELFRGVCAAVQHAHTKGIIHRDLKPSNVLVTIADGKPIPKVIDFGIAKATQARLTAKTLFTEFRQLIGTPEYMSPEQAEASGVDIDTRSDVYSLGVLLYELLTGVTPFDGGRLRSAAYAEIQRIIREEEPPKPSTRVSGLVTLPEVATHRRAEPRRLGTLLRGDLDWIVMRALEKDRTRRYETPSALAEDVRRHMEHEPVAAGPPSGPYRVRKFVRRHRVGVAAGAAIGVVLVLGVIGTSLGLAWALRERERANDAAGRAERSALAEADQARAARESARIARDEAERAGRERDKAERIAEFMEEMLAGVRPAVALGRDTAVLKEILDGAAGRLEGGELRATPEAELRLRWTIGETYESIGEFAAAERVLRGALELAESIHAGDHADIARSLNNLADVLDRRSNTTDGAELVERCYAMIRRLHPEDHEELAVAINNLAQLRWRQNRPEEAEPLFAEAIRVYRAVGREETDEFALAVYNRAVQLQSLGRLAEAEPVFRDALALYRRLFPAGHPTTAWALTAFAYTLKGMGRPDDACACQEEAVALQRRLYPDGHPDLAISLTYLAEHRERLGRMEEAEALVRESLSLTERFRPGESVERAIGTVRLANYRQRAGRPEEAHPLAKEAVPVLRRLLVPGHPLRINTLMEAANVLWACGDLSEIGSIVEEAVSVYEFKNPQGNRLVDARTLQADLLTVRGRLTEAEAVARPNHESAVRALGEHRSVFDAARALADIELGLGHVAPAHERLQAGLTAWGDRLPWISRAQAESTLGACRVRSGDFGEAESLLSSARDTLLGKPGPLPAVRQVLERSIALYEAWHAAEPSAERAEQAARWRAELNRQRPLD